MDEEEKKKKIKEKKKSNNNIPKTQEALIHGLKKYTV